MNEAMPNDGTAALGRVPSGLFILTLSTPQGETGMLASWVQQCSFMPPMVSMAFKKGRYYLDHLQAGVRVGLNIIPEGNKSLLKHFGQGFDPGQSAFDGVDTLPDTRPVALREALATLTVVVVNQHEAGDHVLVLARVESGTVHHEGKPATHFRKSGLHY